MIKQRTELNFGFGSVAIAIAVHNDGIGGLFCHSVEPKPIGTMCPIEELNMDDAEVLITFNSVESVDNIITQLNTLREFMVSHKESTDMLNNAIEQIDKKYFNEEKDYD